jgi:hypothetical protein
VTAEQLVSVVGATAKHLAPAQRVLVARFVGALCAHGGGERAAADRARREGERVFEEHQLGRGPDLERRRREPA